MQIIKHLHTNVVVFIGDDLRLTEKGVIGKNFQCQAANTKNAIIEDVKDIPDDWQGGWYTYADKWTMTQEGMDCKGKIKAEEEKAKVREKLKSTEIEVIPVLEFLINALVDKGVVAAGDIGEVMQWIDKRKELKAKL